MVDDENQLAERVRAHDVAALAEYLSIKRKPLAAYVERELGTALRRKVEVNDILQEVSVEAIRSLPDVDFGDREVFSWLCQIAERRIIDAHRHFLCANARRRPCPAAPARSTRRNAQAPLQLKHQRGLKTVLATTAGVAIRIAFSTTTACRRR